MYRAAAIALVSALTSGLVGCVNKDVDATPEFDYQAMLANYADNLIVPQYQSFSAQLNLMSAPEGTLEGYCSAIGTAEEAPALAAAQSDWRAAMALWQQAETQLVGPATNNESSLRNRIYSFGTTADMSSCAVDQATVQAMAADFDIAVKSYSARGLAALEYLLFNENPEHTCPSQVAETQGWNELPVEERKAARCAYAQQVLGDLNAATDSIISQWSPENGNFRASFIDPSNRAASLKALSDALFYVETFAKDRKLGRPLGLHLSCGQAIACPEAVESPYSQSSLENVRNNLMGFKQMLTGGMGAGFDDIISQAGFAEVVDEFIQNTDAALALIDATDASLHSQAVELVAAGEPSACANSAASPETEQGQPACRLHGYLKRITDSLRTDFVTIVNLDLPESAQSDGD